MIPNVSFFAVFGGHNSTLYSTTVRVYLPGHLVDIRGWFSKPWKTGGVVRTGYVYDLFNGFPPVATITPYLRFNY